MTYELNTVQVLVLSIAVLWMGETITRSVSFLRQFSIPMAVTGGIVCSLVVAVLGTADIRVDFDLSARDDLLLVFFSTVGLSAKFRLLKEGGRLLVYMGLATVLFLILQNGLGVGIVTLLGEHWGYGLIAGSVSLAGGHGTAITWDELAAEKGLLDATDLGLTFATFGMIAGGFVGGPIARYLIRRHDLVPAPAGGTDQAVATEAAGSEDEPVSVTSRETIRTIFLLGICLGAGATLHRFIGDSGIVLPSFLTAMAVGIVLTNVADAQRVPVDPDTLKLFNEVSLHLFLAMSLMSMQLLQLAGALHYVIIVLTAQIALASLFAIVVVFRVCGRNYNAAVVAAGYSGLGLGATPVGVANMNAVTSRFGPSPAAFIVVPLIGAFLLDIINAFVIQSYIGLLKGVPLPSL